MLFRIDAYSGGPIEQASATISDFNNGMLIGVSDPVNNRPASRSSSTSASAPLGTETLVLSAEAPGPGLNAQGQCSFRVEARRPA